jgi:hypothetical protein
MYDCLYQRFDVKGNYAKTWEDLLDHHKLPYMAMLRNLRNIILARVGKRYHDMVINKLSNEGSVVYSRQFPFRFFSAYEVLGKILERPDQQAVVVRGRLHNLALMNRLSQRTQEGGYCRSAPS